MPLTTHELLALQAEVLYVHDGAGRLLRINEPGDRPAPRFFLSQAREGNLWRCRHDLPPDLSRELERLAAAEPRATDLRTAPTCLTRIRALLEAQAPVGHAWHGPAYHFPDTPLALPEGITRITTANADCLRPRFADLTSELDWRQPCVAVIEGGEAVSVCFSARNHPRAAEAGVETLAAYRGQGYATRAVVGWAALVREQGRIPLYSTSWDNMASQAVARRLGLVLYGAELSLA